MPKPVKLSLAIKRLGLPKRFAPVTFIGRMFPGIPTSEIIHALHLSEDEKQMAFAQRYEAIPLASKMRLEMEDQGIDYLIAAFGGEAKRIASLVTEYLVEMRGMQAHAQMAISAPDVAKATAWYAGTEQGHLDRKLILQAVGAAPTPRSSITHVNVTNSRLTQVNAQINSIPRLEDVTRAVEQAQIKSREMPLLEGK